MRDLVVAGNMAIAGALCVSKMGIEKKACKNRMKSATLKLY
jgi:hypothetical protein